ncbi:hypothetical protein [Methanogenium sp. MK-MG]|uniref:hypothetical protein n=1 Tax=Methanogenium sp. MK-MG TaxID=2599926 RepID=UPI0013EE291B|nr:hypothetical protein [Methanogenium sp. MK-MG]KAF1078707.1 hypothetical protein MKMG_00362 [Methanogenium sp. MK-MG]
MIPDIIEIKSVFDSGDVILFLLIYVSILGAILIKWKILLNKKYCYKYFLFATLFLLYLISIMKGILDANIAIILLILFIVLALVFIYSSKGKILWPCSSVCSDVVSCLKANEPNEAEKLLKKNKWMFLDSSEKFRYYTLAAQASSGLSDIRRSFELLMNVDEKSLNDGEKTDLALQKAGYAVQLGNYIYADLIVEKLPDLSGEHLLQWYVIRALSAQFEGDLNKCSELLLHGISECSDQSETTTYQIALNNLGQIRKLEGNYTDALLRYKKSLSCAKRTGDKRSLHINYQNVIHVLILLKKFNEAEQLKNEYYSTIDKKNTQDILEYFNFVTDYCRQINNKEQLAEALDEARERLYPGISREQQLSYDISQLRMRWNAELLKPAFLTQIECQYPEYSTLLPLERYHCYKELDHVLQKLKQLGRLTLFEDLFFTNSKNLQQIISEIERQYAEILQLLPDYCVSEKCNYLWDLAVLEKENGPNYDREIVLRLLCDMKGTLLKHRNYIRAVVVGLDLCDELLGQNRIEEMWECTKNSMDEFNRIHGHPEEVSAFIRIACYAYNAGELEIAKDYLHRFEQTGIQITNYADWIQGYYIGLKRELDTE